MSTSRRHSFSTQPKDKEEKRAWLYKTINFKTNTKTCKSPKTFVDLVNVINFLKFPETNNTPLAMWKHLLRWFIYLRSYPPLNFLSVIFNISTSTVKDEF